MNHTPIEKFIIEFQRGNIITSRDFLKLQRKYCKEFSGSFFTNDKLLFAYKSLLKSGKIKESKILEKFLNLKKTRSQSGIVVVSVLTKPFPCPGTCIFCPTEKDVPKSYLSNEPAVMRAIACKYDPYTQMIYRLKALREVGHLTDKISIRIIGGTWSYYTKQYQTQFIRRLFQAANEFGSKNKEERIKDLIQEQTQNETAKNRIVELSVETRPDYINIDEIKRLRMLGVTKVELGVQSLYDNVLQMNKRGNSVADVIDATKLLKDAGFKVSYQMMPNLFGSNISKDERMFYDLFHTSSYQPDHLKIYPLALIQKTELFKQFKSGKFKPYTTDQLVKLLTNIKSNIPYYCRVERIIRDIPAESIVEGGAKVSNLRQIVANEMTENNLQCSCVRCREVKQSNINLDEIQLFRQDYNASDGKEIFLSFESPDRKYLVSLLRLRISSQYYSGGKSPIPVLNHSAIIRELHTYGPQVAIGDKNESAQHHGFGQRLIAEAERIANQEFKIKKIAVISGIGTREYFRKFGYELDRTYMIKEL